MKKPKQGSSRWRKGDEKKIKKRLVVFLAVALLVCAGSAKAVPTLFVQNVGGPADLLTSEPYPNADWGPY